MIPEALDQELLAQVSPTVSLSLLLAVFPRQALRVPASPPHQTAQQNSPPPTRNYGLRSRSAHKLPRTRVPRNAPLRAAHDAPRTFSATLPTRSLAESVPLQLLGFPGSDLTRKQVLVDLPQTVARLAQYVVLEL